MDFPSLPSSCHCCLSELHPIGKWKVLNRHEVAYFRCVNCKSVTTENPTWLGEAYGTPISKLDVGLLQRCTWAAGLTEAFARLQGVKGTCLDWGGGYGTLTRMLRDRGLNFLHYDPFTENLFAQNASVVNTAGHWDLVTAFEVMEHLWDPFPVLSEIAQITPIFLFSTRIIPEPTPKLGDWWYYAHEAGQHVTFYTATALKELAARLDLVLTTDGENIHILHRPGVIRRGARLALTSSRAASAIAITMRYIQQSKPLTSVDAEDARIRALNITALDGGSTRIVEHG